MKSVVLCGSRRFKPEMREFAATLRELGALVLEPYLNLEDDGWNELSDQYKKFVALGLTHDHFYKIQMADVVFLYNKGGYSGNSTTLELGYAVAKGKPVYALAEDEEICRTILFRGTVQTPEELLKILSK